MAVALQAPCPSGGPPSPTTQSQDPMILNRESKQPTVAELAKYGIKVRDFAFENTLPPIAPVYILPKQIQPNPGVLRPSHPPAPQEPPQSSTIEPKKLEKHSTQMLGHPSGVSRQRGFVDLRDYDETDKQEFPDSQDSAYMLSQPPVTCSQSQESEEYIKTPIVTPNGSLQWQDVEESELPTSQLDNAIPIRPLSFATTPTSGETNDKIMTPSPLSSAHSSFCLSPSPMPSLRPKHRLRRHPSHTLRSRQSQYIKDPTPPGPTARYYLRKRPTSTTSTSKPATRSRLGLTSPLSKPRQPVAPSTPPLHRQERESEGPSPRTFQKRTTTTRRNGKRSRS